MKNFYFFQNQTVKITIRHLFSVSADSLEQAALFIRENRLAESTDWHYDNMSNRVNLLESNEQLESQVELSPETNGGAPTMIILLEDGITLVSDNCGDRLFKAQTGQWRDRALELIRKAFPEIEDDRRQMFVDEYWDSVGTDERNLFNFEFWLYGGQPLSEPEQTELWAFIWHMDVLPRNAPDAQIVAYFESDENYDRDYPIEKLTPDEFACRVNDEAHGDTELYVRFIKA